LARLLFKKSAEHVPALGQLGWQLEAWLLELFWWWVNGADPGTASQRGYRLFQRLGPRLSKNRHVLANLRIAFPHLTDRQREELARNVWGNFGSVLAEYPHLHELRTTGEDARVKVQYCGPTEKIIADKQPCVYVTPHLGNWELTASTVASLGVPLSVVYSPQGNPLIDRMIQQKRESLGVRFITKENAIRQLVREIRSGRSVGLLPDQRIDCGDPVAYFGQEAPTTTSPAWLAIKMKCPLVPIETRRTGAAKFLVVIHEPVDTRADIQNLRERVLEITRQINTLFEAWIRDNPAHWHCTKRRWPKSPNCSSSTSAPARQV
jgi:KDO2-lipid IV(A) lauroyltransferase